MARIGIFAGTFDPVHDGHIAFAREALAVCRLDHVFFLPERSPRTKKNVTDIDHRVKLLEGALSGIGTFDMLVLDEPCFTVQSTLPQLQHRFPDDTLVLLIGSDVVRYSFEKWNDVDTLLTTMDLAVGLRGNDTVADLSPILERLLPNAAHTITYIQTEHRHVSSSRIREEKRN